MIQKITYWFSEYLCAIKVIPKEQTAIYRYGFELLFSSLFGVVSLIVISLLFGSPLTWFTYLLGFVPLRILGGGYHAKTHLNCFLSFSSAFYIMLILEKHVIWLPPISLLTLISNLILAPIEPKNKPLSPKHRSKNRNLDISLCFISFLFSLIITDNNRLLNMYYLGALISSVSLVLAIFANPGCTSHLTLHK